jgi:hypothetical protein
MNDLHHDVNLGEMTSCQEPSCLNLVCVSPLQLLTVTVAASVVCSSGTSSSTAHWQTATTLIAYFVCCFERTMAEQARLGWSHISEWTVSSAKPWLFFCSHCSQQGCWTRSFCCSDALPSSTDRQDTQTRTSPDHQSDSTMWLLNKGNSLTTSNPTHSKWYHSSHLSHPIICALSSAVLHKQYNLRAGYSKPGTSGCYYPILLIWIVLLLDIWGAGVEPMMIPGMLVKGRVCAIGG